MAFRQWVLFSWRTEDGASGASIGVADHCVPAKGLPTMPFRLLDQGPDESVCFCDLLRWSVGRHGLLRYQCP